MNGQHGTLWGQCAAKYYYRHTAMKSNVLQSVRMTINDTLQRWPYWIESTRKIEENGSMTLQCSHCYLGDKEIDGTETRLHSHFRIQVTMKNDPSLVCAVPEKSGADIIQALCLPYFHLP